MYIYIYSYSICYTVDIAMAYCEGAPGVLELLSLPIPSFVGGVLFHGKNLLQEGVDVDMSSWATRVPAEALQRWTTHSMPRMQ